MEINAEMNKVFGQEMAKLFAATIDEEELTQKAQQVWLNMNKSEWSYNSRTEPEIEKYIKDQILNRLYEKIEAILKEPINEEALEKKAREMVNEARRVGEETIIRDMAHHMADNVLSAYGRDERIVQGVLAEMRLQHEQNRLY
jgi:signal-transduction protein with cAMP-binding, CBS, and nucleotidyltransferase domain